MNYGQVRDQTLKLLNQYTVAGAPVAETYNNQADYINRIPGLVNDAMTEIATTVKKIPATLRLDDLPHEDRGHSRRYELPDDFFQFKSGDTLLRRNGSTFHTNFYTLQGKKFLIVPQWEREEDQPEFEITYYRYPAMLGVKPADSDKLDNDEDTHFALPFYVASFLVADDNPFLCSLFYNKYEDKLGKMIPGPSVEVHPTDDAFRFYDNWWDV